MKNELYTNGVKYVSIHIAQLISELLQVRVIEPIGIGGYELSLVIQQSLLSIKFPSIQAINFYNNVRLMKLLKTKSKEIT